MIDDAIVVVENIVLHRDAGQGRMQAVQSALSELKVPLVGSTLTPVVIFLPLILICWRHGNFLPCAGDHDGLRPDLIAVPGADVDTDIEPIFCSAQGHGASVGSSGRIRVA